MAGSDWSADREKAVRLIENGDYRGALTALQQAVREDPSGSSHALMALACFHIEDYAAAVEHYAAALAREPGRSDWRELRAHAQANLSSQINVPVPDLRLFDRDELLQLPVPPPGALPSITRGRKVPRLRLLLVILGSGLGCVCSLVVEALTWIYGSGYHGAVWTNWYRRPRWRAILTLAYMREELNRHNLRDAYPKGELTGFQPRGRKPPPGVESFRTADGSWNNLENPMEGAAGTRFSRNVANGAICPESGVRLLTPDPREVSRKLLTRGDTMKEVPFLNLLAAAWIQFQTHDWVSHGENLTRDSHEIPLSENDEARRKYLLRKIVVGRTQPDPTRRPQEESVPVTYINEVTHWWDGSQIYGSDWQTLSGLRSGSDGKLKIGADGRLPLGKNGVEETGFVRNWWVGLSMLHALFVKEHNAICDRLKAKYPHWDDARLFNVARLINAAVMAKIHTIEWTPAILPNRAVHEGLNANWYGLATNFLRSRENRKTLAEINIRNPELGGVVGNPIDKHGAPYSLTEEFVEVYRLHSLLPEALDLRSHRDHSPIERVPLAATRQAGSGALTSRVSMTDLLYSFGNQHPGALELNNYPKFMQELSVPGNPLLDLGAVDILRARERGVPRYNEFRRQLLLKPIRTFRDLTDDEEQLRKLEEIYGHDVEALDLLVGTLAEQSPSRRPTNFGFGETLFQIFILNATRRLQADRFYTTCYNAETYTKEGLDWIDDADLKTVLLRHYPELAGTGLANIRNAFEPWDNEEQLDPARHPLRAFDRELRPDPLAGERGRIYFQQPVQFQKISSANIAYRKFGSGKPLIFLHGWPLAGVTFRKLIPFLQNDFTCYVPDLPGGGETTWYNHTDFSWPGQAQSVKHFIDALGLESYFLLGQDSGAMIGRQLALIDGKRIRKFAMTNTEIPCHRPRWIRSFRWAMRNIPRANTLFRWLLARRRFLRSRWGFGGAFSNLDLIDGEFREYIVQPLVYSSYRMQGHMEFLLGWHWGLLDSMKEKHRKISMPVLLIWGEDDQTFPVAEAEQMVKQFPNCRVCRIPHAKLLVQEEKPERLSKILLDFMK